MLDKQLFEIMDDEFVQDWQHLYNLINTLKYGIE